MKQIKIYTDNSGTGMFEKVKHSLEQSGFEVIIKPISELHQRTGSDINVLMVENANNERQWVQSEVPPRPYPILSTPHSEIIPKVREELKRIYCPTCEKIQPMEQCLLDPDDVFSPSIWVCCLCSESVEFV